MDFFADNILLIVFLHVISGVIWVGGMVAMRYAAHYSFLNIEDPKLRLESIAYALKRLFYIVLPFTIMLLLTAIILVKLYSLNASELSVISHAKEGIWSVMFLNLLYMIYRRNKAEEALKNAELAKAKELLGLIGSLLVPLNITLGTIAIFSGVYLSRFF